MWFGLRTSSLVKVGAGSSYTRLLLAPQAPAGAPASGMLAGGGAPLFTHALLVPAQIAGFILHA